MEFQDKQRIVQELVPGRQITLAHLIANPDESLLRNLGLESGADPEKTAIGVLTVSPSETAIILGDIAIKSAGVKLGFLSHLSGSLIITGSVSEVETSFEHILEYVSETLGYEVCQVTRT
ncbi:MAG: BMC domain-containing protein [Lachnospiraceae bacterium]|nr:BMC domain-containing protein [Lachnospiraceae bacterium]